jgi:hypothetical protein
MDGYDGAAPFGWSKWNRQSHMEQFQDRQTLTAPVGWTCRNPAVARGSPGSDVVAAT